MYNQKPVAKINTQNINEWLYACGFLVRSVTWTLAKPAALFHKGALQAYPGSLTISISSDSNARLIDTINSYQLFEMNYHDSNFQLQKMILSTESMISTAFQATIGEFQVQDAIRTHQFLSQLSNVWSQDVKILPWPQSSSFITRTGHDFWQVIQVYVKDEKEHAF